MSQHIYAHEHPESETDRGGGLTLWFTGLSGSGKTTIAHLVGPELDRRGLASEHGGRFRQTRGRLVLALGVDDLGAALALRFRLARDCPLHLDRKVDLLHLDGAHLDAPRFRLVVDDLLELMVDRAPLGEQLV